MAILLNPRMSHIKARQVALGTVLGTLALSLILLCSFSTAKEGPQFSSGHDWLSVGSSSIRFAMGLDGISLCFSSCPRC